MKLNAMIVGKSRRIAASLVALAAMFATSAARATDLESSYFRYDFSDGTRQFIGSASQASDPAVSTKAYFSVSAGQMPTATRS